MELLLGDSEIASVEAIEGDGDTAALHIRFAAAAARTGAAPGERAPDGFVAGVLLVLTGAHVVVHDTPLIGRVAAGVLRRAGQRLAALPLPGSVAGPLRLELALANGGVLVADAASLAVTVDGAPAFTESSAC
jgi:hypothetical protein